MNKITVNKGGIGKWTQTLLKKIMSCVCIRVFYERNFLYSHIEEINSKRRIYIKLDANTDTK